MSVGVLAILARSKRPEGLSAGEIRRRYVREVWPEPEPDPVRYLWKQYTAFAVANAVLALLVREGRVTEERVGRRVRYRLGNETP